MTVGLLHSVKNLLLLGLFFVTLVSSISYGQQPSEHTAVWSPPTPVFSQQFDWLQLRSGEWLRGDIISMYEDELEFDSDEFNTIFFDWQYVAELRSRSWDFIGL